MPFPGVPNYLPTHILRRYTSSRGLPATDARRRCLETPTKLGPTFLEIVLALTKLARRGHPFIQTLLGDTLPTGPSFFLVSREQPRGSPLNQKTPSHFQAWVSLPPPLPPPAHMGGHRTQPITSGSDLVKVEEPAC